MKPINVFISLVAAGVSRRTTSRALRLRTSGQLSEVLRHEHRGGLCARKYGPKVREVL
jgi:hypothetical protein